MAMTPGQTKENEAKKTLEQEVTLGKEDLAAKVSDISQKVRSASEGWSQSVQEGAANIAERAQGIASKAQDLASNAADKTSSTIRQYPLQSLLVGFGIGCVMGFLIPRR